MSYDTWSVEIRNDGTICFFEFNSNLLLLFDTNGDKRKFELDIDIRAIAVYPVSDDVYCTMTDNSVRLVDRSTGSTTKLFVPEGIPYALAFGNDGTVCRTKGMIALACMVSNVLVIDCNFTELYRYAGPPGDQRIKSCDAIFDGFGHLLVADCIEKKGVHIVSAETEQHMQTITTDNIGWSQYLTINHDGHVLVGAMGANQLLSFKYWD